VQLEISSLALATMFTAGPVQRGPGGSRHSLVDPTTGPVALDPSDMQLPVRADAPGDTGLTGRGAFGQHPEPVARLAI
jgi:hypothetical protein